MSYLITQIFVLLLAAALLGMILGWYLTRLSAESVRASLQARLKAEQGNVRQLRDELDTAASIKGGLEAERQALLTEIDELKSELKKAAEPVADHELVQRLEGELMECREAMVQLQAAADAADVMADNLASASSNRQEAEEIPSVSAAAAAAAAAAAGMQRPSTVSNNGQDNAPADNLRQIKGIGPKIAGMLDDLGIRHFAQIAAWTPDEVESINGQLSFKGRIEREQWIAQAQALIEARDSEA
jgi:NADH-quinone oxidoreductase subunit E